MGSNAIWNIVPIPIIQFKVWKFFKKKDFRLWISSQCTDLYFPVGFHWKPAIKSFYTHENLSVVQKHNFFVPYPVQEVEA
jgi:hypothetical protein